MKIVILLASVLALISVSSEAHAKKNNGGKGHPQKKHGKGKQGKQKPSDPVPPAESEEAPQETSEPPAEAPAEEQASTTETDAQTKPFDGVNESPQAAQPLPGYREEYRPATPNQKTIQRSVGSVTNPKLTATQIAPAPAAAAPCKDCKMLVTEPAFSGGSNGGAVSNGVEGEAVQ